MDSLNNNIAFVTFFFFNQCERYSLLQDSKSKVQSVLQSLWSPSKPRSPLSDSSSMHIQEGKDSDTSKPEKSEYLKEIEPLH